MNVKDWLKYQYKKLFEKKYLVLFNPDAAPDRRVFKARVIEETDKTYTVIIALLQYNIPVYVEKIIFKQDYRILEVVTRYELF